jgi:serine/threonine-protein kinase
MKLAKGATVKYWVSSGKGKVEVPDVVGMKEADAVAKLVGLNLKYATKPEVNPDFEVGEVIRQSPAALKSVDAGTTVTLTVAAANNTVKVPPLVGTTQDYAVSLLGSMNLVPKIVPVDSTLPGGIVDHQSPEASQEVERGSTVTIYVSNAPEVTTVKVPPVAGLGLTEAQAKARLAALGLKAKIINLETPDYKPGICIHQSPAAGATVEVGSVVQITIARAPATTTTTTEASTTTTTLPATTTTSTSTTAPPAT